MMILTQWKNKIVNLDKMETVFIERHGEHGKNYIFAQGTSGKGVALGQYENEARAKEVLQEIAETYWEISSKVVYEMPSK